MNTPAYASASLYVGDLLPDVTESQLYEIFKALGPVASIRVCRDAVTRRSLGYAYVNYHNFADAERAVDLLNYKDIKGKPCRIMWSQRDPSLRKSGSGNIFIKNLHKDIDNKALYDTFATFGNILSCKVAIDEHGNSKGYGFIHYETQEAANLAVEKVNGKLLNGKQCYVGPFVSKKDRSAQDFSEEKWTNIFVKDLDLEVDEDKLREMFGTFGTITSAVVMKTPEGKSKGFAFINYEGHKAAQAAIETMHEKEINGKALYVGRAQKKAERERELKDLFQKLQKERQSKYQGVNLYVKNLDETIDDEQLRQAFATIGTITSAKVMREGKSTKGFGFVCFSTPEEATKAVTEMNGKLLANKPIYVALAQRKDQRRAQLDALHAQRTNGMRMQQQTTASGVTGAPIYATGAPIFYPPTGRGGFVGYPQQMMRGPRFGGPRPQGFQPVPFVVPVGGQPRGGGQKAPRNPKGGPRPNQMTQQVPGYPGIKYNPNVRNQQFPIPQQQPQPQPGQEMAQSSDDARRQMIGDTLYPLISQILKPLNQEDLTGKITGMLLESMEADELLLLVDAPDALNKKVVEAIQVLEQHVKQTEQTSNPTAST